MPQRSYIPPPKRRLTALRFHLQHTAGGTQSFVVGIGRRLDKEVRPIGVGRWIDVTAGMLVQFHGQAWHVVCVSLEECFPVPNGPIVLSGRAWLQSGASFACVTPRPSPEEEPKPGQPLDRAAPRSPR